MIVIKKIIYKDHNLQIYLVVKIWKKLKIIDNNNRIN